mgnify:CR=1 FL=1
MNIVIKTAFDYALLARAAYTNLTTSNNATLADDLQDMKFVINSENKWPPALATYFQSRYEVVDSELNGKGSYQGILFRDKLKKNIVWR